MRKKIVAIILSMSMTISMCTPVFAGNGDSEKALTKSDFIVETEKECELVQYDNDVLTFMDSVIGDTSCYYFFQSDDYVEEEDLIGKITLNRNIILGESKKSDLLDAYGIGVSAVFDPNNDLVYKYNNYQDKDEPYFRLMKDRLKETIFYNYKDLYQIIFFIDNTDTIRIAYFLNTIQYTADSSAVKYVQETLNSLGYNCGTPDGIMGNNTKNAILSYQKDRGMFESGIVDDELLKSFTVNSISVQDSKDIELMDDVPTAIPEGLVVDEGIWDSWESTNTCSLFPFMFAAEKAGFTFGLPSGQQENHKVGTFNFLDGDSETGLDQTEFYYGVINQKIIYTGLSTDNEEIYTSQNFKEACIRLLLGYNSDYEAEDAVLNLTRERAEEIVNYCFNNKIKHCVVDDMRIRLIWNDTNDNYYSFHMEY